MELVKKNIHMDRIRAEAVNQITLEDDMNIPDSKPDVGTLNFEKGTVIIDEVKPGTDHVNVRGRLLFAVLYHTDEEGSSLVSLEGKIPFEERVNLDGTVNTDTVTAEGEVEDLSVTIINSRKLNIQSVVTLRVWVDELYDEEAPIGLYGDEAVEYRRAPMDLAQIAICKNDIFRVKEELSLPSSYPNIFQILWSSVSLGDMEYKVMEEKLNLQGEIHVFLMYEGEGEDHPIRTFETSVPVSGVLDCHGSREGMIPDIRCTISPQEHGQQELSARPDFDGEERNIGLELVLDVAIRLYEEERMELITDIYGVTKEVQTLTRPAVLRRLLSRVTGKMKVTDHIRIRSGGSGILQLLHSEGKAALEDQEITPEGVLLSGSLQIQVLYITGSDASPYDSTQAQIPYQYTLEVPEISPRDTCHVRAQVEQLQVTMLDGEEMDVKAVLSFSTTVFRSLPMDLIESIQITDLDTAKLGELPGMAIYMVRPGDNLWNIGRKYYVPVDRLRELNNLSSDDLKPGQKILIVKGG